MISKFTFYLRQAGLSVVNCCPPIVQIVHDQALPPREIERGGKRGRAKRAAMERGPDHVHNDLSSEGNSGPV